MSLKAPCAVLLALLTVVVVPVVEAAEDHAASWQVGVARIDITPEGPILLSGYAARSSEATEAETPLWARALAFGGDDELAILLTVESVGVPRAIRDELVQRLSRAVGLRDERFTLCSTHTHTGPSLTGAIPNMFGRDLTADEQTHIDAYTRWLVDRLEAVCVAAVKDRGPARLAWGQGKMDFAANRRTRNGPVDHAMPMLRVDGPDGKLRAVLVNYACHCTTLGPDTNKHCGDWAGFAVQEIDAAHPGAISLVSIGCGADANPHPRTGMDYARQHGKRLAAEVERLLKGDLKPVTGPLKIGMERFELAFDPPPTRDQFAERAKKQDYAGYHARKNLARLDRGEKLESRLPYSVQAWTFGDELAMVFLPGEVVVDYALRIKKEFDASRLWVMAYANDVPCYVPSRRILAEGGYEAEGAMLFYDHPTRLAPAVENDIVRRVHALLPESFRTPEQKAEFPDALSPEEALAAFQLPDDLRIELVAAEPLVVDPVAIDWGPDGRLWVVEMHDYPTGLHENGTPGGRIKFLEDSDGDGRYDRAQIFLDGLPYASGVLHWRKGVLICAAPDILYAEDTDGDGKADVKKVLFTGFSPENQQFEVNSLMLGLDGWVYGASSVVNAPIRSTITGKTVELGNRDFRMNPDTGVFEPAAGRTQYGRTRDDFDNWFGCDNSNWLYHYPLPEHYARRNPHVPSPEPRVHVARTPGYEAIHPISRTLQRFNEPQSANRVTSACGVGIYRDELLGAAYYGNAFICEPVHNVVRRFVLKPSGVTFTAVKAPGEEEREFLASKDNWFRPAQVRTGPDGGLWVVDMYRFVIEHPRWITAERLATLDVRAGDDRGRIYRIVPKDGTARRVPNLAKLPDAELAKQMDSPNGTLRDLVQQELVERNARDAAATLQRIARESRSPAVRVQALYTLCGLGHKQNDTLVPTEIAEALFKDADPLVRQHVLRAMEGAGSSTVPAEAAANDPDIRVRYQLALSLDAKNQASAAVLPRVAQRDLADGWMRAAVLSSPALRPEEVLAAVLTNTAGKSRDEMIGHLIATAVAESKPETLNRVIQTITPKSGTAVAAWQLTAAASILDARDRKNLSLDLAPLGPVFERARELAADPEAGEALQVLAIRLLGRGPDQGAEDLTLLAELLAPQWPAGIQQAAATALGRTRERAAADALLAAWPGASPALRSTMLDGLLSRPEWVALLLGAIESKRIMPAEIDAAHRELLFKHADRDIRERAATLMANVRPPGRKETLEAYKAALTLKGNAARGAATFAQLCTTCHAFRGQGHAVGPNLAALTDRSTAYLFNAILDPNAAVEAKYTNYIVDLEDGRTLTGIVTDETASSITVVQGNGVRDVVLRADITEMRSSNLSMMPEGLEQDLTPQQLADLIAYVQSGPAVLGAATAPQMERARQALLADGVNGLAAILHASEVFEQPSWIGTQPMHYCRQTDGRARVEWQTAVVPTDLEPEAFHRFRLAAAMGYLSQPAGTFELRLEGKSELTFNVTTGDASWASADGRVRMQYMAMAANTEDSTGVLVIEAHASRLQPGKPARFEVIGSAAGSQRWFGVLEFPPTRTAVAPPSEDTPRAAAAKMLDEKLSAAERGAVLARHPEWAVELVVEMTRDLTPGTPEEYRRIPWIWRAAIDVGKRNEAEQVRRLLEVSLPKASEPLLDWQAVVIGGGVINGLGLVGVWPRERIEELLGSSELRARWERSLELAAVMTDNEKVPQGTRYDALRMIAMRDWKDCGEQLERYLGKGVPGELQQGAVSGLCDVPHPRAGELLVKYWADLVPPVRGFALDGLLRTPQRARLLQDAVEAGKISAEEVGPERLQKMRDVAGK